MKTTADQLEWRRSKVIELRSYGLSYADIAKELKVSKASIVSDMKHIRQQAKENIREYITERLPEQFEICLSALDTIIRRAVHIMETTDDNSEVFEALELFKQTHFQKLSLLSDSSLIENALSFIRRQQEQEQQEYQYQQYHQDVDQSTSIIPPIG